MREVSDRKKGANCSTTPVSQRGEGLLRQSHSQVREVSQRLEALWNFWEKLRQAVTMQGQALEDKCNFLEFLQRVDLAEAWIQEKVRFYWIGHLADGGQDGVGKS